MERVDCPRVLDMLRVLRVRIGGDYSDSEPVAALTLAFGDDERLFGPAYDLVDLFVAVMDVASPAARINGAYAGRCGKLQR